MRRLCLILTVASVLGGCGMQSSRIVDEPAAGSNYRQTRNNAPSLQQADAACWEKGMGIPSATQSGRRMAYEKCMNAMGWDNPAFQSP